MNPVILICDILEALAVLVLLVVMITAWLSSIERAPTWYLFILSCLFSSVSALLILGNQEGSEPKQSVCLAQAALIYTSAV